MFNIRRAGFKQGYSAFPSAKGERVCPERVKRGRANKNRLEANFHL